MDEDVADAMDMALVVAEAMSIDMVIDMVAAACVFPGRRRGRCVSVEAKAERNGDGRERPVLADRQGSSTVEERELPIVSSGRPAGKGDQSSLPFVVVSMSRTLLTIVASGIAVDNGQVVLGNR